MCELIPDATLNDTQLPPLLECLVAGLQAEPRVATNVCWAISALSERAYESAQSLGDDDTADPETYWLSKYFEALVERLLETTGRTDGNQVGAGVVNPRGSLGSYQTLRYVHIKESELNILSGLEEPVSRIGL